MNILISILFSSILIGCTPSVKNNNYLQKNQTVLEGYNLEKLKFSYQKLTSIHGEIYEQEYFDAFPNSFYEFNSLFGYSNNNPFDINGESGPLYDVHMEYIEEFFGLKKISEEEFCNKIIDLSIGGRWYADAVSLLRYRTHQKVFKSLNLFNQLLSKRNDKEIQSFWRFYFDGPHPPEKLPKELEKIKELNEQVYYLMMLALKEVQKEWKE